MATLTATAASPEAHALVAHLVDLISTHERSTGARQRARRAEDEESFSRAVAAFLGDLLARAPQDGQGALIYRSMNSNKFSGSSVGYRQFMAGVEALGQLGLIDRFDGFYDPRKFDFGEGVVAGQGKAARFRATPVLLSLAAQHDIAAGEVRDHFRRPPPDRVIVLKAKSTRAGRRKVRGGELPVPKTAEVQKLADQVRTIDAFLVT